VKALDKRIDQIATHPKSCPESQRLPAKPVYSTNKEEIEVITLFDNRQDPNKLQEL